MNFVHEKRLVVKVGSQVVLSDNRVDSKRVEEICGLIADLAKEYEVIVVFSGAVATGLNRRNLDREPVPNKQALSAIGQPLLMHMYYTGLKKHGLLASQLLLTYDDLDSRKRSENTYRVINKLLSQKIIPTINENDLTAVGELIFGDNNVMSAYATYLFHASLLVVLSRVDGYYDSDPQKNPNAKLLKVVNKIEPESLVVEPRPGSVYAQRGIVTKLEAAKYLLERGGKMFLTSAYDLETPRDYLLRGVHEKGTLFINKEENTPVI
uniref:Glutamate 5-kinase n=1 Tax=Strigomonas galati TaxID=1003336 RepID=U5KN19_9TRYP|nr:glutamate 5-kinase [Strigomonas galati]